MLLQSNERGREGLVRWERACEKEMVEEVFPDSRWVLRYDSGTAKRPHRPIEDQMFQSCSRKTISLAVREIVTYDS